ncbi:MAG TPA: pitrilysin family protein [Gemmatimonadales bacterium]|nr:pitrilysin family protein [Gemmatimonadales bacterium]
MRHRDQLSAISYRLSAISYQLSAIGYRPAPVASGISTSLTGIIVAMLLCVGAPARLSAQVTAPPVLGAPKPFHMPKVQTTRLANGLTIDLVEMHKLPLVNIQFMIDGGARLDGDLPGLATFTADMLDEGAGTRDAIGIAAEAAYLGADLNTGADWDHTTVSLQVPTRTLPAALDLMADVVLRPHFHTADVDKHRGLRMADILQRRDVPAAVASLVSNALIFPAGHPYHVSTSGDSASTVRLDSTQVRRFYDRIDDPRRATVVVTGDITLAQARALLARRFGGWKVHTGDANSAAAAPTPAPVSRPTTLYLVDKPGAAQSVVVIGAPGVPRSTPDYYALEVMNTILGGSFSSRLNQDLRETKGYTYGAGSRFQFRPIPGPFTASAAVRTNVTDSSLTDFFVQLHAIRDSLVQPVELTRATQYLALGLPGDFETTGQVARQLSGLLLFGLPFSYYNGFVANLHRVTRQDVQRVARRYIDPDHLTVVVVGDLAKIRAPIEALHLGPVVVVDADGKAVP